MNLETLRELLAGVLKRMEDLNNSLMENGAVREMTQVEEDQYREWEKESAKFQTAIKRAEAIRDGKKETERLDQPANKGARIDITREHNHNEQGDYRGYGEVGRGGFGEFLKDVHQAATQRDEPKRLKELRAALGSNESVGSEGGFLVQSDHADNLFSTAKDAGQIASRCMTIPVSGNSTTINLVDETSIAVGSQFGGVQAYWRAEASAVTATKPKFRQTNVRLEALEALYYATEEQLEDAPQLEAFANLAFTTAMAWQLDDAIVSGNGAGKPLGIINSPCLIAVAAEGGQTADTVNYLNVDHMCDRVLTESKANAVWFIHPNVKGQLRNMVNTPGSKTDFLIFMPANGMVKQDNLLGYPVVEVQQCRALGDVGDILLADFSKYALFRKSGIRAAQSMHVAFLTSERCFKWTLRANGMPLHNSAITDAYGSTTRSPFIALAAR